MRVLLAAAVILAAGPAPALGPVSFGPTLDAGGWSELTFRGRPPAEFVSRSESEIGVLTETGVSLIYRPLGETFAGAQEARWRWRVEAAVPPTDLGRRGEDDRSLAVYFLFADDPEAVRTPPATLAQAMRRGRALVYVWGGAGEARRIVESPHMGARGRLIVQRPATSPTGVWTEETVDLRSDFAAAFGRPPGPLVGVALSADSDDTGSRSVAALAGLVLR